MIYDSLILIIYSINVLATNTITNYNILCIRKYDNNERFSKSPNTFHFHSKNLIQKYLAILLSMKTNFFQSFENLKDLVKTPTNI